MTNTTTDVVLPQNLPGVWNNVFQEGESAPADSIPIVTSDYVIFVDAFASATATYVSAISTSGPQTFTITGANGAVVFWQVIRITNSTVAGPPYASAYPTHN